MTDLVPPAVLERPVAIAALAAAPRPIAGMSLPTARVAGHARALALPILLVASALLPLREWWQRGEAVPVS